MYWLESILEKANDGEFDDCGLCVIDHLNSLDIKNSNILNVLMKKAYEAGIKEHQNEGIYLKDLMDTIEKPIQNFNEDKQLPTHSELEKISYVYSSIIQGL